jgi:hypothetical protein
VDLQLGTLVVPRLVTPWTTYTALFLLVALHLGINYLGVRGLVLRTLNRQRTSLAWSFYRSSNNTTAPSPVEISNSERILTHPGVFRDSHTGHVTGKCTIGLPFFDAFPGHFPSCLFDLFRDEKYLLWYDHRCLRPSPDGKGHNVNGPLYIHIVLKDGYNLSDQLRAWIHATELCTMSSHGRKDTKDPNLQALSLIQSSHEQTVEHFPGFIAQIRAGGWNIIDGALMPGSPRGVLTAVVRDGIGVEEKKIR